MKALYLFIVLSLENTGDADCWRNIYWDVVAYGERGIVGKRMFATAMHTLIKRGRVERIVSGDSARGTSGKYLYQLKYEGDH